MSLAEQTASGVEGAGNSPFLFDPNFGGEEQITIFTNWAASLMQTEAPGSLLACGNLDLRSPKADNENGQEVTIAGGFNQRETEWTWSIEVKDDEQSLRLVSDVDLDKKYAGGSQEGAYKFDLDRDENGLVSIPGNGNLNLPNLWQQISRGHQGKLVRDNFVYDANNEIAAYIRKAFFRNVFLRIESLQVARETAEAIAANHNPGFTSNKIVPYNAVGFRGSTGVRTIGFASPISHLDRATRSERVIAVDELPAIIGRTLNIADPVFDCPVATLDPKSIYQTKVFDIKDLAVGTSI